MMPVWDACLQKLNEDERCKDVVGDVGVRDQVACDFPGVGRGGGGVYLKPGTENMPVGEQAAAGAAGRESVEEVEGAQHVVVESTPPEDLVLHSLSPLPMDLQRVCDVLALLRAT